MRAPQIVEPLPPITLYGQEVLHRPAAEVTVFDDRLAQLVERMQASMLAAPGAGLAAPQIGIGLRVFVYDTGPDQAGHVVNPVLRRLDGGLQEEPEGCLSVPELAYDTSRFEHVEVTGVDVHGQPVRVEGEGFLARCLQHETDHLDGRLYLERLGGRLRRQAMRELRAAQWYGEPVRVLEPGSRRRRALPRPDEV